ACGGFLVSDRVPEMDLVFGKGTITTAGSPQEFMDLVRHYATHPQERSHLARKGQEVVLNQHTYFQRIAQFFRGWDMPHDAENCLRVHSSITGAGCSQTT